MAASYQLLDAGNATAYIRGRPELASRVDPDGSLTAKEIGNGNLNLVFRVRDDRGRSLILKQALPFMRLVGPDWPMSPQRAEHEARALVMHRRAAPELVPELLDFDPERFVLAIEDLSDHHVWRDALNRGERHEGVAAALGRYVAAIAYDTSALHLGAAAVRERRAHTINSDLCAVTERLVFTEPFTDAPGNSVLPANAPDAAALAADRRMLTEMAYAKWVFETRTEALIHGDLHTGSVMIRTAHGSGGPVGSVKAFDSEFAFDGPVAYDLGVLWANYVIAASRAVALDDHALAQWALGHCEQTWNAFELEFRARFGRADGPAPDGVLDRLLGLWRSETWLFAAAEIARRVVGLAKTTDTETLPADRRAGAARGLMLVARSWARERHVDTSPALAQQLAEDTLGRRRLEIRQSQS